MSVFGAFKYSYGTDHHMQSLLNGIIGIPDRPRTAGRKILETINAENKLYFIIYMNGRVVGTGISYNGAFHIAADDDTFTPVAQDPGEHWGHRINAAMSIRLDRAIDRETLRKDYGINMVKGSFQRITEEQWIALKNHFAPEEN